MYLYSGSLRKVRFLMANSSWTKNHVDSVLNHRDGLLDFLNVAWSIAIPVSLLNLFGPRSSAPKSATIVYPPCETQELVGFDLKGRENIILSVAQFRCVHVNLFKRMSVYPRYLLAGLKKITRRNCAQCTSCFLSIPSIVHDQSS